jgi:hypothetical protein
MPYELLCHQTFAAFRIGKGNGWRTMETGQWGVDIEDSSSNKKNTQEDQLDGDKWITMSSFYLIELDVAVHLFPPRTPSLFFQLHQSPS